MVVGRDGGGGNKGVGNGYGVDTGAGVEDGGGDSEGVVGRGGTGEDEESKASVQRIESQEEKVNVRGQYVIVLHDGHIQITKYTDPPPVGVLPKINLAFSGNASYPSLQPMYLLSSWDRGNYQELNTTN